MTTLSDRENVDAFIIKKKGGVEEEEEFMIKHVHDITFDNLTLEFL
jgi:hypothetical protein